MVSFPYQYRMKTNIGMKILLKLPIIGYRMKQLHFDLLTDAGKKVIAQNEDAWQEYPRPQMKRDGWMLLNGMWKVNGRDICVPFPPQSILSGYGKKVDEELIYEKEFEVSADFNRERVLLHFGAVDQIANVFVNGRMIGIHEGGYLPFAFDITDALQKGSNRLEVQVKDSLSDVYPYGKQKKKRGGMWYTPVSGIWQSVWLENVPENYILSVNLTPDLQGVNIEVKMDAEKAEKADAGKATKADLKEVAKADLKKATKADAGKAAKTDVQVKKCGQGFKVQLALENGQVIERLFEGKEGYLALDTIILDDGSRYVPKLWTPDTPYLYQMKIITDEDTVETYFALRTIGIEEKAGKQRVCLNGKPIFLYGVLDQGYYSDGIYLPAEASEYTRDILRMKELGINLLRKHIKVEPEFFYYECDRLGMLVMQDMVNSGPYSFLCDTAFPTIGLKKRKDTRGAVCGKRKEFFIQHTKETIAHLYNHPSVIAYTIFNEGWGQFQSDGLYQQVKDWDHSRLVDSTSGWFWQQENDFDSEHIYFKVIELHPKKRPLFVTECGGYTMAVEGHMYSKYASYGYGTTSDGDELTERILYMYEKMILPFIKDGVCGCIYTQLSDVEDEINGLYTYDRKVCKVNKEKMRKMAMRMAVEVECA